MTDRVSVAVDDTELTEFCSLLLAWQPYWRLLPRHLLLRCMDLQLSATGQRYTATVEGNALVLGLTPDLRAFVGSLRALGPPPGWSGPPP